MTIFKEDFSTYNLGELAGQGGWQRERGNLSIVDIDGTQMAAHSGNLNHAARYYKILDPPIFGKRYYGYSSVYPGRPYYSTEAFFGSNLYCLENTKGWGTYQNRGSHYQIFGKRSSPCTVYDAHYNDEYFTLAEYDFNTTEYKYIKSYHPDAEVNNRTIVQDDNGMLTALQTGGLIYAIMSIVHTVEDCTHVSLINEFAIESYGQLYNRFPKWKKTHYGLRTVY